ncbi:MAG: permease-like cell division protein FtsX [Candidatus Saccharibacteria bacterium]|jgi:cell division transport system permease protein
MKKFWITFNRVIKTGFINFFRNLSLALPAIAVMTVTLFISLFLFIANVTFSNTINQINNKINITIYLADSITNRQLTNFEQQLKGLTNVKSVDYVSKDEALAIYKSENAGNQNLLNAVDETGNPLPASLNISPYDINKIQDIKNFINQKQYKSFQDAQLGTSYSGDRKQAIDRIAKATTVMREAGVVGIVIFALVSALIIFNTLRMAIFNRKDEITIMRLLGAKPWYIRGPFVVEACIYGFISALVSIGVIKIMFSIFSSSLEASSLGLLDIGYATKYFNNNFWLLVGIQLLLGLSLGALFSIIATARYLKLRTSK